MTDYYVGLMSGTSMDGIDAVLVSFADNAVSVEATHSHAYPADLRRALLAEIRKPLTEPVDATGDLNRAVGECFAEATITLLNNTNIDVGEIACIGSHGQTLRHCPDADPPFTIQIGDPSIISTTTKLPVVADFRTADIEAGGQGAPLVPPFHEWLFRSADTNRVALNIGGIANITVLPADGDVTGFDTGPGNGLMDAWTREQLDKGYDESGALGSDGRSEHCTAGPNARRSVLRSATAEKYGVRVL